MARILPKEFCKNSDHYQSCIDNVDNGEFVYSCSITNSAVWFGINFYESEGVYGNGGLGLYNRKTNIVEVRRIPALEEIPIHKVVWDGKYIWAATTHNYECTGHPPALGLIKYDWDKNILQTYKATNTGPCGFIIYDLLWSQESLWVATDVGISRWDSKQDKWMHYLPDTKPPYVVKESSCDVFYETILNDLSKDKFMASNIKIANGYERRRSAYSFFLDQYLSLFRPDFTKRYKLKSESNN